MKLKIVLEKGLDGYIVAYCPALKGCVTQGKTEEEAIANLKEAVELWLEPDPSTLKITTDSYKICEVAI
jgi:predicted RNase H-like HicB family nuclease